MMTCFAIDTCGDPVLVRLVVIMTHLIVVSRLPTSAAIGLRSIPISRATPRHIVLVKPSPIQIYSGTGQSQCRIKEFVNVYWRSVHFRILLT